MWMDRPTLKVREWGLVIVSPEVVITEHEFSATNNETEYEALIARLGVARELGVQDPNSIVTTNWLLGILRMIMRFEKKTW